jgi:enoyl-CoA hydratase/carnithine racemase
MNGHALAGGCLIGLTCDYRVMLAEETDNKKKEPLFGLNEAVLGM